MSMIYKVFFSSLLLIAFFTGNPLFTTENIYAASLHIGWYANPEGDISGYRLYCGTSSYTYDPPVDVGNVTDYILPNLVEGTTYYLSLSALDTSHNESDICNEVTYTVSPSDPEIPYANPNTYEDAEDGSTDRWYIYDNTPYGAQVNNVYDSDRQSNVIELSGSGINNGYRLKTSDGTRWNNSSDFTLKWSMKYSERFAVYVDLETTAGHRYLTYSSNSYNNLGAGEYPEYGLGEAAMDGQWHTFVRDLQADLEEAQPGVTILEVNGFLIRGSGMVDDIALLNYVPSYTTTYEDAEDGSTERWYVYDNYPYGAEINNVYDSDRQSNVIELSGSGINNGYRLKSSDGTLWNNSSDSTLKWSMKYSENFIVYIDLETTAGHRYLTYKPNDYNILGAGEYVGYGLGEDAMDGQWHTFVRDLQADLEEAQPGVTILEVNGFLIRGSGMLDDIALLNDEPSYTTTYENAEDGSTDRWYIYDNTPYGAQVNNVYDSDCQSNVIELSGSGINNGYRLKTSDGTRWYNSSDFTLKWSMNYSESFGIYIDLETTAGHRYLTYSSNSYNNLGAGEYPEYGLGEDAMDGQWHTFVRDLQADLEEAQPGVTILEVNGFLIRGSGMLDDIMLYN